MGKVEYILQQISTGLTRKKTIYEEDLNKTRLVRKLSIIDLTSLGVGSTLGAGIYVLAGAVAKEKAGPGVIISFMIAALASMLAGLCYAEFGARVPTTGSAYIYSYFSVGEFMAFVIGWNLVLENTIGVASISRAWSANFDAVTGNNVKTFLTTYLPMHVSGLSPYADLLAFAIVLVPTTILAIGVKESANFSKIFTSVNLYVVVYCIIVGLFKADINNWTINATMLSNETISQNNVGQGGFLPFGFTGVIAGAGSCFYAFVGFDTIATTGEESDNPQRAIPIAVIACLIICSFAYLGVSSIVTLAYPYYLLDKDAPLPFIFEKVGWSVAKYVVAIGSLIGLSSSLLGAMFPLPRVLFAMANDGLLFKIFGIVHSKFKTPFYGTIIVGLFSATMACIFDLQELVNMIAIGTLLAYSLVAISVLVLRSKIDIYASKAIDDLNCSITESAGLHDDSSVHSYSTHSITSHSSLSSAASIRANDFHLTPKTYFRYIFKRQNTEPTVLTEKIVKINTALYVFLIVILNSILIQPNISSPQLYGPVIVLACCCLIVLISLKFQPENHEKINFKVPGLPWIPGILIFVNIQLMMQLPTMTWIRFGVWMAIGLSVYFFYATWNSKERKENKLLLQQSASKASVTFADNFHSDSDVTLKTEDRVEVKQKQK